MAIETVQEKNKRLTKEVQELKKALADMTDIVINKDKEIDRMRKRAETDFAGSPTYLQMCEKIKRLNAEVTLAEKRIAVLQQRCSEYSQRSAAPDLKHNERGAGRKKALSEDQIAEFEKLLQQGAGAIPDDLHAHAQQDEGGQPQEHGSACVAQGAQESGRVAEGQEHQQ